MFRFKVRFRVRATVRKNFSECVSVTLGKKEATKKQINVYCLQFYLLKNP